MCLPGCLKAKGDSIPERPHRLATIETGEGGDPAGLPPLDLAAWVERHAPKAEEKARYEDKRDAAIAAYNQAKAEGKPLPNLAPQWVLDLLAQQK